MEYNELQEAAAVLCHNTVLRQALPNDSYLYCPPLWDGWGCWNYTRAGQLAFISCPPYLQGFDTRYNAHRYCTEEGDWWRAPTTNKTWANYTGCVDMSDLNEGKRVLQLYIFGYSVSIFFLVIALFIFTYFRQLQCARVTLHKNLFTCYIINGIVWILYYRVVAMNSTVLAKNPIWCQTLHCLAQYFTTCNFFWMFCEGLYLHTVIVIAFVTGKKLLIACYIIGWGVPVLPTVIYIIIRALNVEESIRCWLDGSNLAWIIFGPIVATLFLNMIFMFNIVRVLITKLRAVNTPDTTQTRKAVRAALILIPLLGLQFVIYPVQPPPESSWSHIYQLTTAFVTSFQGFFVAIIFCFVNGEVISVIKRRWGQHRLMRRGSAHRPSVIFTQGSHADNTNHNAHSRKQSTKSIKSTKSNGSASRPSRLLLLKKAIFQQKQSSDRNAETCKTLMQNENCDLKDNREGKSDNIHLETSVDIVKTDLKDSKELNAVKVEVDTM